MTVPSAVTIYAIEVVRGDDDVRTITFKDATGTAIDITGWTVFFTVKRADTDADASAVLTKNITSHTTPLSGITTLTLLNTDLDALSGVYVYDLQVKTDDAPAKIYTIMKGPFIVHNDVTRRISV